MLKLFTIFLFISLSLMASENLETSYRIQKDNNFVVEITAKLNLPEEASGYRLLLIKGLPINDEFLAQTQKVLKETEWSYESQSLGALDWQSVTKPVPGLAIEDEGNNVRDFKYETVEPIEAGEYIFKFRHYVNLGILKHKSTYKRVKMDELEELPEEIKPYLEATKNFSSSWNGYDQIVNEIFDGKKVKKSRYIYKNVEEIYNHILDVISYNSSTSVSSIEEIWQLREADSSAYARIITGICRHMGIPARTVSGHRLKLKSKNRHGSLSWGEFWIPKHGWVPFDGYYGKSNRRAYFGQLTESSTYRMINRVFDNDYRGARSLYLYYWKDEQWMKLDGKKDYTYNYTIKKYRPKKITLTR